jgi:hypothetical protein
MSKISMNLTSSSGTWLKDCLQPQHYYVSINVEDPNGEVLARVALSYEQAAKMLLYNGDVECTLERYRNKKGELVSENVVPPTTVHQRMNDRLKDSHDSLAKRLEDVRRDVYELLNAGKASKSDLKEILQNIEVIQSHYKINENFVVQQAEEELSAMQNNAAGQLGIFLQSHGVDVTNHDLKQLLPIGTPLALPEKSDPVQDDYQLKERTTKPIESMTALEISDCVHVLLKKLEKQKQDREQPHLYQSSCSDCRNGIMIQYIGYQGKSKLSLEESRKYLQFLISINNDIKKFKTHFHYNE